MPFDSCGYSADDPSPDAEVWLWASSHWDGRTYAIGFCILAPMGDERRWTLTRVWFHPFERRRGNLSSAWHFPQERYGGNIPVDGPSIAMEAFLAAQTSVAR